MSGGNPIIPKVGNLSKLLLHSSRGVIILLTGPHKLCSQFAVNPADGEVMVIEMNPRVSRSSALASKATGFPIAKMAAKLSVGYTLDKLPNDITKKTPASFEPSIDYVVTKVRGCKGSQR